MRSFVLPHGEIPLGGVFGGRDQPLPTTANAHVGPHSLQVAPDGSIWATLALGNQLARFDPGDESWRVYPLDEGFYPHTLRFDHKGRIWFTLAVSNHVGLFDPATEQLQLVRLPAASFGQAVALRLLPALLWLSQRTDLSGLAAEGGDAGALPVPYGIDVAPDGGIWFSQLNEHKIGRIDPDTLGVELIDTPFSAPRRLRFDSKGALWIPGFSSSVVARFDPKTRTFETFALPIEPAGSETPYALHVDRTTDTVWICGTNSDTLIRLRPTAAGPEFTVYPLPTRVTYTREIDFDAEGRVWTSNSNAPTWQIEGGFPRVLRLDPAPAARAALAARSQARE
jgi:streptogramin lyase